MKEDVPIGGLVSRRPCPITDYYNGKAAWRFAGGTNARMARTPEEREKAIIEQWDGLLKRLEQ